jgi:hypothetical protein
LASCLAPPLEQADGGPAVDPLSLPEGFQADLPQLEGTADALLERQAGESLAIPTAKIVRDRLRRGKYSGIFPLTA